MGTFLFVLFLIVMIGGGAYWLYERAQRRADEADAQAYSRAHALGINEIIARGAAPSAPEARAQTPPAAAPLPPSVAAATATSTNPPAPAKPAAAPPVVAPTRGVAASPTADALLTTKRARFARITQAYFEASGYRSRRYAAHDHPDAPIDVLLFMGDSQIPAMAVRWSRTERAPVGRDEARGFCDACAALKIARGTLLSQHGFSPDAQQYAHAHGVTCLDAEALAIRLAALDPTYWPRLHIILAGEDPH